MQYCIKYFSTEIQLEIVFSRSRVHPISQYQISCSTYYVHTHMVQGHMQVMEVKLERVRSTGMVETLYVVA